ncbi:protein regulator of cytokinesis 1-like isoform X2 [Neocloeon triangulifer]|uniref:protein regulator of cytokinesis 1-like isoform X2 n=1 Tax=Neocloeon triangulifer TaxID=2078957 RepID=UPI00286EF167|nr:protein regulator of cytokinesis 1-like isoform X2 [Neocloeon triangulifer]
MSRRQAQIDLSLQKIDSSVRQHLAKLLQLWEQIGLSDEAINSRFAACQAHVNTLFQEMENEDEGLKAKLKSKVEVLLSQLAVFNLDLDKNESIEIDGLTLIAARDKLDNSLKDLKLMHQLRLDERTKLEMQELKYCEQLGRAVEEKPAAKALSDPVMRDFRERVTKLKQDKDTLLLEFLKTRSEIIDLYSELEEQPSTEFQFRVTDPNTDTFPLDPDTLANVAVLHADLDDRVKQVTEETEQLRMKLAHLWDRLEVDVDDRAIFMENNPGIRKNTRQELRSEIIRCEELKKQNMEKFTLRMRDELINLWDQCHVSDEEREAFAPFKSLDFTEELLEQHEVEVKRYEAFLEENKEVFNLLSRRAELWERMCQLEIAATDSNRLNNRGGQLLKEEKERKQIQKELPKVEERVKRLIHAREEVHGEPFLLNGRRASLVLSEQWESKRQLKEAEKHSKKMAQQKQLEREAMMGTTMMSSAMKRKMVPNTPEVVRKQPRITPAKAPLPVRAATTAGKVGKFAKPVTRPTQRKLQMAGNSNTGSTVKATLKVEISQRNPVDDSIASSISYTDFTNKLMHNSTTNAQCHASIDGNIWNQELPEVVQFPLSQSDLIRFAPRLHLLTQPSTSEPQK